MSAAVDTNVMVDLLAGEEDLARAAATALDAAHSQGAVVLCPAVYAELLAYPDRDREEIDRVLAWTGIEVEWHIPRGVWAEAGGAYARYDQRRRVHADWGPRRILDAFVIGAHARMTGALITRDLGVYAAAFPDLRLIRPEVSAQ